ncbi:UNVERIFIED_CONTAM: hypothetical protein HDU68_000134 [Siphonaria sp. JEL0065]|nr:hypothetical protein HDU68_000134 [Siphonaria sp. JEL0065]
MSWRFGHFWAVLFNFTGMGLSRPIYQFLAIKFVLFISYLQTFTLTFLVTIGFIKGNETWTPAEVVNAIASFLTCFEMFGAAVMNCFAFSWNEFHVDGGGVIAPRPVGRNGRLSTGVYGALEGHVRLSVSDAILDAARPDDLCEDAILTWGLVLRLLGWKEEAVQFGVGYDDEDYDAREGESLLSPTTLRRGNQEST